MTAAPYVSPWPPRCFSRGTARARAQQCGGDFGQFLDGVRQEALAKGMSKAAVDAAVADMRIDDKVLAADRAQGVFAQDWRQFASRMVNGYRLKQGKANLQKYASVFDKVKAETGVPGPVIASFWGLETDYGAVLGSFDTLAALATLAHDCRRPELFRPHLIAAIEIVDRGYLEAVRDEGRLGRRDRPDAAPAGGIHRLRHRRRRQRHDRPAQRHADVLTTTGKYIKSLGWQAGASRGCRR